MAMQDVGYQLVDKDGNVLNQWGGTPNQMCSLPNPLVLPNGDRVLGVNSVGPFQDLELRLWSIDVPETPPDPILTDDQKLQALLAFAEKLGLKLPGAT